MADVADWNAEFRKIERECDGFPPERSPAQVKAQRAAGIVFLPIITIAPSGPSRK